METRPRACVVAVGDELLAGRVADANSAYVSARLRAVGVKVCRHVTVGDAAGALAGELRALGAEYDLIVITGGLGPSEDDRTRAEVAAAIGEPLEFHPQIWEEIERYLRTRGTVPTANNRNQAQFPRGAEVIRNRYGSAPAFRVRRGGASWWSLPGVPREMAGILEEALLPEWKERQFAAAREPREEVLRFFAVSESEIDSWISALLEPAELPQYHIRASDGEVEVRHGAARQLAEVAREKFGANFLGTGEEDLATRLVREATSRGLRIACAESCTGGMIGARLTSVSGASQAFAGGWIAYSNALKERLLHVPAAALEAKGAVSAEIAVALAARARELGGADWAVAATGISGPGGGSSEKPVGTTFLAVAGERGTAWRRFQFSGDRDWNRTRAALHSLFALYRAVLGDPLGDWTWSG
ncbi:MAG: CinA family nicotinamide mononucleotide deamidase-related protein [Planctomycetes bacterium]|nr:CinA family nicotinamide mononucleotide deamidase-related protein [Planctomycetota bacterium]